MLWTVPPPDKDHFSTYIRAQLFHSKGDQEWKSKAVKVKDVSPESGADFMYNEQFQWEYDSEELAFIRCALSIAFSFITFIDQ